MESCHRENETSSLAECSGAHAREDSSKGRESENFGDSLKAHIIDRREEKSHVRGCVTTCNVELLDR